MLLENQGGAEMQPPVRGNDVADLRQHDLARGERTPRAEAELLLVELHRLRIHPLAQRGDFADRERAGGEQDARHHHSGEDPEEQRKLAPRGAHQAEVGEAEQHRDEQPDHLARRHRPVSRAEAPVALGHDLVLQRPDFREQGFVREQFLAHDFGAQ